MEAVLADVEKKMKASIEVFQHDCNGVRTGRASLALLDGIVVNYYGTPTPLHQVATLSVPESRQLTIQPWDPSLVPEVEKAILKSGLGLTPINDGKIIRIKIPPLTEERRHQLAKLVKKMAEDCRVAIRNVRRDGNVAVKALEKSKGLSEDESRKAQDRIQKLTDRYIQIAEEIALNKEKEILEI